MTGLLRKAGEYLAQRKGLPVLLGALLVVFNFVLSLFPAMPVLGWIANHHVLLHLGIVIGLLGILIGDAL